MQSKINLNKTSLELWKKLNTKEKEYWSLYFELNKLNKKIFNEFKPYKHSYNYKLSNDDVLKIIFCIIIEILRYNKINNMQTAFLANSGGLDSAVICGLLAKTLKLSKDLGEKFKIISYGLPIESNPEHNLRATQTTKKFKIKHITINNLDNIFKEFEKSLLPLTRELKFNQEEIKRGFGNVKARIRMVVNFFGTTQKNSYVMSTDNLSELFMAFWTLMGDVGTFAPIQTILKGLELPAIAYALGVPEQTIGSKPTDGLNIHKSRDSQEGGDADAFFGIEYPHLDAIMCLAMKNGLELDQKKFIKVDAKLIDSKYANQKAVDKLIKQIIAPSSIWKREKGSIGTFIDRKVLGLKPLSTIANKL